MFFIIFGLVTALVLRLGFYFYQTLNGGPGFIFVAFIAGVVLYGLAYAIYYLAVYSIIGFQYDVKVLSSTKLVGVQRDNEDGLIYVKVKNYTTYTYYESIMTDGENMKVPCILESPNVEIAEDNVYTLNAKLVKTLQTPKRKFWTYGLMWNERKIVFYVPKGTVEGKVLKKSEL